MSSNPGIEPLSEKEYARRKQFLGYLKGLTKSEYAEIVHILQKHEVNFSENTNGIFFNVATLPLPVFENLENFIHFTHSNRQNLSDRDTLLSTLKQTKEIES
jgi:hypothetical protein